MIIDLVWGIAVNPNFLVGNKGRNNRALGIIFQFQKQRSNEVHLANQLRSLHHLS